MKIKLLLAIIILLMNVNASAQFSETFSDGNYTSQPIWTGDTAAWVVNKNNQLQSRLNVENQIFYLSTESNKSVRTEWKVTIQLGFNPSSANYVDVYLTSSASNLTRNDVCGYFVRIGNTTDEISLYRKDATGQTEIIDGVDGSLNSSSQTVALTVRRDANHQWQLLRQINNGSVYAEGAVIDSTYLTSSYFGLLVRQSTASFFGKHYFDDIEVRELFPDLTPPSIESVTVRDSFRLDVFFSEPVDKNTAVISEHYSVDNGLNSPTYVLADSLSLSSVQLIFPVAIPQRTALHLTVKSIKDLAGNVMQEKIFPFNFYLPKPFDIVIHEIMADPSPQVGLPDAEWIELKNTTPFSVDLQNWKICKSNFRSESMPRFLLPPDSMVIVCSTAAAQLLKGFGQLIALKDFPSLYNAGDCIFLQSSSGNIIHAVQYNDSWYNNQLKKNGGWSLEMKDGKNPCGGAENWTASSSNTGGTPGKINTAQIQNPDNHSPELIMAFARDSLNISLFFNESLDSLQMTNIQHYQLSEGIGNPVSIKPIAPLFNSADILLQKPLLRNKIYEVHVINIQDCAANTINQQKKVRVGLSETADSSDVIINEVLFNPKSGGVDFVELYNRSNKIINLKNLFIAEVNRSGNIQQTTSLCVNDYLFFPGDYVVLTEDASLLQRDHWVKNPTSIIEQDNFPALSDDEGTVLILNERGETTDRLKYSEDWHFKLITDKEGVSLERINYNSATQLPQNWHSAAASSGYATPSYTNSQQQTLVETQHEISVEPEVISPDNDGYNDIATIYYHFSAPGYVANIVIYDAAGRPVRSLEKSALCGLQGYFRWDGLNNQSKKLPSGIYVIYTEVFNLKGVVKRYKNVIAIAER